MCGLAHPGLYVVFYFSMTRPLVFVFFCFASSSFLFSVAQIICMNTIDGISHMSKNLLAYINTCLSLAAIHPLKTAFFPLFSCFGPLSPAASNLGIELPFDCPFSFPQKEIIYDFPTQANSQINTVSAGIWGITIPPDS